MAETRVEDSVELLQSMHTFYVAEIGKWEFVEMSGQGVTAITLFCRMVKLAGGMLSLHNTNQQDLAPLIFRSLLEAHALLRRVLKCDDFHLSLWVKHLKTEKKVLQRILNENPSAEKKEATIEKMEERDKEIEKLSEYDKEIYIREHFQEAEMDVFHKSFYHGSSDDVHNGFNSRESHFAENENGTMGFVVYGNRQHPYLEVCFEQAGNSLIYAAKSLHDKFGIFERENLDDLFKQYADNIVKHYAK